MRTRCLPLNEEESRQTVATAAEGVAHTVPVPEPVLWQELSEKRRWQSHEILVNFQLQTNLFVFPAGATTTAKKNSTQKQSKTKTSWQIWLPKLGSKARSLCPRLRLSPHIDNFSQALRRLHINTYFCRRFFNVCLFCFRFFLFFFVSLCLTVKFSFPGWGTHRTARRADFGHV